MSARRRAGVRRATPPPLLLAGAGIKPALSASRGVVVVVPVVAGCGQLGNGGLQRQVRMEVGRMDVRASRGVVGVMGVGGAVVGLLRPG